MRKLLIVVAAGLIIAMSVQGCGSTSKAAAPTAKSVNAKLAGDISVVVASTQSVQIALGLAIKSDGAQADVDQLARVADSAHSRLAGMKMQVAVDAPVTDAGAALASAVNELKNSMGALTAYTGNPNPSTLASFTNQYQRAVSDWDAAVSAIYAGTVSTPPSSLDG